MFDGIAHRSAELLATLRSATGHTFGRELANRCPLGTLSHVRIACQHGLTNAAHSLHAYSRGLARNAYVGAAGEQFLFQSGENFLTRQIVWRQIRDVTGFSN